MTTQILVVVGIFAVVAGIAWLGHRQQQQRIAELEQVARVMQFSFAREAPPHLEAAVSGFPLCNAGRSRKWRNVMTGKVADRDAVLGDYSYVTGSGKHQTGHNQTVAVFPDGGSGLPDFTLAPENFFDKIGQAFGYQDIDFEASEEFSKRYLLRGEDEVAIRRAFNAEAIAFFSHNAGWSVQASHGSVAVFLTDRCCKPQELPAFLADALRIQDSFTRASSG